MGSLGKQTHLWFLRLRLFAALGACLFISTLSVVSNSKLPLIWLLLALSVIPLSDRLVSVCSWLSSNAKFQIFLVLDSILLTFLLALSGGPANPFSLVYLVLVVLAAVLLDKQWTWRIALLSSLCFTSLFSCQVFRITKCITIM